MSRLPATKFSTMLPCGKVLEVRENERSTDKHEENWAEILFRLPYTLNIYACMDL
jgi:hypothetical protein